eukprot:1770986-Pleurochrysis_carterae.AAC.2
MLCSVKLRASGRRRCLLFPAVGLQQRLLRLLREPRPEATASFASTNLLFEASQSTVRSGVEREDLASVFDTRAEEWATSPKA